MIDRDTMYDVGRYLMDGLLVAAVWIKSNFVLLSADALWTKTFGEYAELTKLSVQVIITIIIAVTAFYRMRIMIRKFREGKRKKKDTHE